MISLSFRKVASLFFAGTALVLFQLAAVQKAFAHHPIVTSASAACVDNAPVISFTVVSWNPGDNVGGRRDNPEVDVLFNGIPVFSGAFQPNTNPPDQFSGSAPAPAGADTVDVAALAVAQWGDGYPGGEASNTTITVTVPTNCAPGIGRFTGGGKQVTLSNVVVTKGFEVDCDLHEPSNNLEINWSNPGESGSHHFHMLVFTAAICTFVKKPNPPTAPVNTIVASGTGRYDNVDGYTVQFELVDNGEPGSNDAAMFKVFETANPNHVVLNAALQVITTGNIQAHVDQK
jgi:hypothetical protein